MMKVIGEEGTSLGDYVDYLKGEFFDFVYLQQNAFDPVDEATSAERQKAVYGFIYKNILQADFAFSDKESALHFFHQLRQLFRGWNSVAQGTDEYKKIQEEIQTLISTQLKSKKDGERA
jgi:V/A-type H+-transporting ATPase subunit A